MKDLKEFKQQHELDDTINYRKPRSSLSLLSGMLLGALAIAVIWPAAAKWGAKEKSSAHAMSSKKLVAMNEVSRPIDVTRSPSQDKARVERVDTETAKSPRAAAPEKKVAVEVKATPLQTSQAGKAKVAKAALLPRTPLKIASAQRTVAKAQNTSKKNQTKIARLDAAVKAPAKVEAFELIEEGSTELSAADVQARTDDVVLKAEGVTADLGDSVSSITIFNAQYEKSTLNACKARCLLKAKDVNGNSINAIISGPNFADILAEHNGTINITGKKTTVKNHEVFMVQSITFNLSSTKSNAQSGKASPSPTKPVPANRPYTGRQELYEDLSSDPLPVR